MLPRLLAALVVLFWIGSTGWLVQSIWFESETRFEPVDPEEALGAFFRWNDQSTLEILDNGRRLGPMYVGGFEGIDPRTGEFSRGLSTQGNMDGGRQGANLGDRENLVGTNWRMTAEFDEETRLKSFQAVLRVPRQELDVRMELDGDPAELATRVTMAGVVLLEVGELSIDEEGRGSSGGRKASPTASSQVPVLPPAAAAGWLPGGALLTDEDAWRPKLEASRGVMKVAGSDQVVYLVKVKFGEDETTPPLRLYFSEAGEPWRIDTGWGFEAVAEVLIPVEDQIR